MFQRKLPTLNTEAYYSFMRRFTFFAQREVQELLKHIGSNACLALEEIHTWYRSRRDRFGTAPANLDDILHSLHMEGYVIVDERPRTEVKGAITRVVYTYYYRVNWKQIRQLNKAISLL